MGSPVKESGQLSPDSRLRFRSERTSNFTESVIPEMSRLAIG
jgi:hypothetical protein